MPYMCYYLVWQLILIYCHHLIPIVHGLDSMHSLVLDGCRIVWRKKTNSFNIYTLFVLNHHFPLKSPQWTKYFFAILYPDHIYVYVYQHYKQYRFVNLGIIIVSKVGTNMHVENYPNLCVYCSFLFCFVMGHICKKVNWCRNSLSLNGIGKSNKSICFSDFVRSQATMHIM